MDGMLIFGGRGYLGGHFLTIYPDAVTPEVDLTDHREVTKILDVARPAVVINCVGQTGRPNVDWCEEHQRETLRSNVLVPLVLLEACAEREIYWVHLSTGCIYEGDRGGEGYSEEDSPNFFGSFYARTKGWADQMLKEFAADSHHPGGILQLRLRMPFDGKPHERNLITKLTKYRRVLDVPNSLTSLSDFLVVAKCLIERRVRGTYNVVNPGAISPYRIMELYREIVDPLHTFEQLTLEELPQEVKAGRSNCVLSVAKLGREGIKLPPIEEALRRAFCEYRKHVRYEQILYSRLKARQ
jgi:dTDP-4-dehydrorhamnose reductase